MLTKMVGSKSWLGSSRRVSKSVLRESKRRTRCSLLLTRARRSLRNWRQKKTNSKTHMTRCKMQSTTWKQGLTTLVSFSCLFSWPRRMLWLKIVKARLLKTFQMWRSKASSMLSRTEAKSEVMTKLPRAFSLLWRRRFQARANGSLLSASTIEWRHVTFCLTKVFTNLSLLSKSKTWLSLLWQTD